MTDPTNGTVSFWERIAKLGAATVASLGIIVVGIILTCLVIPFSDDFRLAWWVALGFLFGSTIISALLKR